ncbi:5-bromo-4-chloroindolyl phosphate hydrolysis family protein [Lacticaseibacillus daqingensis]|uniref:5-bromo-4-chloroindolyl phosphate hydrolysis family protein n=1 Tax=Lacticaseibacillus daqingensis TaxID=2486014 RepID=UPI000F7B036B|nr:5-bromo-4-chloroindolyl phosphate hydrolysis family protein [Lacticaseibacillus daqingensis]
MKKTQKRIRLWRIALWTVGGFALGALSGQWWLALFVAVVFGGARLIGELSRPRPQVLEDTPPLTEAMAAHYADSGLSDSEVDLFRDTMDTAAEQIRQFDAIADRVPKIRAVALNHDLQDVLHAYFKAVVKTPAQLANAGHFIYEQLPNLVRIAEKYEEISHHEVKTSDTYTVLTTAANTLSDLAESIRQDYAAFVENDLEALSADINLARKQTTPRLTESTVQPGRTLSKQPVQEEMEHTHE